MFQAIKDGVSNTRRVSQIALAQYLPKCLCPANHATMLTVAQVARAPCCKRRALWLKLCSQSSSCGVMQLGTGGEPGTQTHCCLWAVLKQSRAPVPLAELHCWPNHVCESWAELGTAVLNQPPVRR